MISEDAACYAWYNRVFLAMDVATKVVVELKIAATSVARKAINLSTTIALFVVASRGGAIQNESLCIE